MIQHYRTGPKRGYTFVDADAHEPFPSHSKPATLTDDPDLLDKLVNWQVQRFIGNHDPGVFINHQQFRTTEACELQQEDFASIFVP